MSLTSLDIQGYAGLDKHGYGGLDTLKRAAFLRPVQIVRQTISNLETGNSRYAPYHRYKGLSIATQKAGELKDTNQIPIGITNPIPGIWQICGYKGLR